MNRITAAFFLLIAFGWLVGCTYAAAPTTAPSATSAPTATSATPTDQPLAPTVPPIGVTPPAREPTLAPQPTSPRVVATAAPGSLQKDVTYCTPDGDPQKMDLYFPKVSTGRPFPVIVYVHGGGWHTGDKASGEGMQMMPLVTQRGYLFVTINYRLAPKYKFPTQIQDVKCAVRFLRANPKTFNLDPNRIGAMGSSAGGHLVALLGLTDKSAGYDVGEYLDQSSRVNGVVDLFGPADLTVRRFTDPQANTIRSAFGVQSPDDPLLAKASPVTYVSKNAPPFLILQGDKDTLVPLSQSQELYDRLKAAGAPATLVIVKNAGHGFAPTGGAISPSLDEIGKMVMDFFDKNVMPGKT